MNIIVKKLLMSMVLTFTILQTHQINAIAPIVIKKPTVEAKTTKIPVNIIATAYCSCAKCCGIANNKTASGTIPSRGRTIAVPKNLLGKTIVINGLGTFKGEDTGSAIKRINSNTIKVDVYMGNDKNAHKRATQFGVKRFTGYIIQ